MNTVKNSKLRGIKILLINDNPKEYGGAETVFLEEKKILKQYGIKVYVFSFDRESKKSEDEYIYEETKNIFLKKLSKFTFNYRIYVNLKKYIKSIKPDLVHLHMHHKYPLSVLLALKNQINIYTAHSPAWLCATGWAVTKDNFESCECGITWKCVNRKCIPFLLLPFYYFLSKIWVFLLNKYITIITTPSKFLKNIFELNKVSKKIIHMPNFVDHREFRYEKYPEKSKNVLYMGMLVQHKGVHYLIKSFPLILKNHPDANLIILGDGKEKKSLKKMCEILNIQKKVKFYGRVPHHNIKEFISESNVIVVPSLWNENSPMVVYEASSVGRPVVGSKRGGIPELVKDGETGYIVNPGDIEMIAEKVSYILSNPSLGDKLGKNGRKIVEMFLSIDCFTKNLINLIYSYIV